MKFPMQQKADDTVEEEEAERKRKEKALRARMAAARKKRKPTVPGSGRKPRKIVDRPPIAVSVKEALQIVPVGRSTLFKMLQSGAVKSSLVHGIRAIDYASLKAAFAPSYDFMPGLLHKGMSGFEAQAARATPATKSSRLLGKAERGRAEARRDPRQQPLPLVSQL
jgi:hypothetical protein